MSAPKDLRAEVLAWVEEQEGENGRPDDMVEYDDNHDSTPDWSCSACYARVYATKPYRDATRPAPFPHESWCAAVSLPLALAAIKGEVEAHWPEGPKYTHCNWCGDEDPCPALRRLHFALLGGNE